MISLDPLIKFPLGEIVMTPAARTKLSLEEMLSSLRRHSRGDWGDIDSEGRAENDSALQKGAPLASIYRSSDGIQFYIVTEWDRSITTVLLPEEF